MRAYTYRLCHSHTRPLPVQTPGNAAKNQSWVCLRVGACPNENSVSVCQSSKEDPQEEQAVAGRNLLKLLHLFLQGVAEDRVQPDIC